MTLRIQGYEGQNMISLGKFSWSPGAKLPFKVYQDMMIKEFVVCVKGKGAATFSGTKPTIRPLGFSDGLIKSVTVSRNGTDKVKSLNRLRKALHNQKQVFGVDCPNLYSVNATDLSAAVPGVATFGSTTQNTAFAESFTVMFENKLTSSYINSLFSTAGLQTAVVEIECGALADIQNPDEIGTVTATFTADAEIEVFASCADHLLASNLVTADWVETSAQLSLAGAIDRQKYIFLPEDELQGILFSVLKANEKPISYEEMASTKMELAFDGSVIFSGSMLQLAQYNNNKTMKQEIERGSFYWNFLNNSSWGTGLKVGVGRDTKPIELTITQTVGACTVYLEYDKIVRPRVSTAVKA